ncbi:PhoPQ-activated protein PqaA family protein [Prosthecobacter sp.]|uniref:PhoPQ-activated protein PqaA family protein n=1 Tax=Prosthecobacter sp. TaxID=1965333 RepID=UPI001E14E1E7|nr:PhoPQ-activated protein PqaA family protein [Prosthecobacter sp.]MCB1275321.1 prolyl oligopeptidase family serine peptidase [Prosthecobacter sp.]
MRFSVFTAALLLVPSLHAEKVGPWDLDALKSTVPAMKWVRQDQPIQSLTYAGEKYQGHDTEVFAFYASPITIGEAKPGTKFPGVVLIHGGGGTAFADWVHLWAKRGYAAIAMDLNGSRPPDPEFDPKTGMAIGNGHRGVRTRLPNGGPAHGHPEKFDCVLTPDTSDDWPFHAAASVMRTHSLLRSFAEVDAEHTAVTGISWGGYTTCLVASLDDRFKAAVPVYGCGFLHEGESVQKPSIDKLDPEHRALWVKEYDPGSLLPRCHVPIFFVNGTNDVHYVLDSYMKSYNAVPGEKHIRIQIKMPHGHPPGWAPQEIGLFIDSKCRDGKPLPNPGTPVVKGDQVEVTCESVTALKKAELNYTTDTGLRSKREWKSIPASLSPPVLTGDGLVKATEPVFESYVITAPKPPADANTWFIAVTDERGAMVSTPVQFSP